jgi:DNA-binding transcriptional MerR regulator
MEKYGIINLRYVVRSKAYVLRDKGENLLKIEGIEMKEKTYTIKEVAEILEIEAYVLRYYEEKLELNILRNSQGHRVYTLENIEKFRQIKELREQGFQLKAVKNAINQLEDNGIESLLQMTTTVTQSKKENDTVIPAASNSIADIFAGQEKSAEKAHQLSMMMKNSMIQALQEFNDTTKVQIKEELSDEMNLMVGKRMREIEMDQKKRDEKYYSHLDEAMREIQQLKKTVAELEEHKIGTKSKGIFKRWFNHKEEEEITFEQ